MLTADEFAFAATSYKQDPDLRDVALFLLHQGTHLALTALNRAVAIAPDAGSDIVTLFAAAERFAPEIGAAFRRDTKEEKQLFNTLMDAAQLTESHTWPKVTVEEIELLQDWVCLFLVRVEKVYKESKRRKLKVVHDASDPGIS